MNRRTRHLAAALVVCLSALAVATPALAGARDAEHRKNLEFLDVMSEYLDFMARWRELVADEEMAALLAQEGIKEIHEQKGGSKADAIPALEKALARTEAQSVRNMLRFSLRDLYKQSGQHDKALAQLEAILAENEQALRP